ncbi:MAG: hypothetical protein EOM24_04115 [Chloroflexia bacterium]|nr:hypothetical protein [Chloroflexia bacterium]
MSERTQIAVGVDVAGQIWRGHFGMAPAYQIYDRAGSLLTTRVNPHAGVQDGPKHHHTPQFIVDLLPECGIFIGRVMGQPDVLARFGVTAVRSEDADPAQAIRVYLAAGHA